jgi:predicted membrane protein
MAVTRLSAETGGGNVAVVLPEEAADLSVTARSGAGNVTVEIGRGLSGNNLVEAKTGAGDVVVHIPEGVAARIQAVTGLGKAIVDPRFSKIEAHTYQSPDFERAAAKVELNLSSGAGNVKVG